MSRAQRRSSHDRSIPKESYFGNVASRESAQNVLLGMIHALDKKVAPLQTLAAHISWDKLNKEEEEGLWEFFCNLRREFR